jgi:hypothetical protein
VGSGLAEWKQLGIAKIAARDAFDHDGMRATRLCRGSISAPWGVAQACGRLAEASA